MCAQDAASFGPRADGRTSRCARGRGTGITGVGSFCVAILNLANDSGGCHAHGHHGQGGARDVRQARVRAVAGHCDKDGQELQDSSRHGHDLAAVFADTGTFHFRCLPGLSHLHQLQDADDDGAKKREQRQAERAAEQRLVVLFRRREVEPACAGSSPSTVPQLTHWVKRQPEPAHALHGAPTFTSAPAHGCRGRRTGQVHVPVCQAGAASSAWPAAAARWCVCALVSAHWGVAYAATHTTERGRERETTHRHTILNTTAGRVCVSSITTNLCIRRIATSFGCEKRFFLKKDFLMLAESTLQNAVKRELLPVDTAYGRR